MPTRVDRDGENGGRRNRRLDAVIVLLFGFMILGGLALFPLSVTANRLSGLWITLCASLGID